MYKYSSWKLLRLALWLACEQHRPDTRLDEEGSDLGTVVVEGSGVGHAEVRLLHVQLSCRHLGVLLWLCQHELTCPKKM